MKQIALLKKKAGLARDAFIRLYEEEHAVLIARLLPFFDAYHRNYPVFAAEGDRQGFAHDVIMEMWFAGPDQLARLAARMGEGDVGDQMARDEERLFDRPEMLMFTVEEVVGIPNGPQPPARKLILLGRKAAGVDRGAFRDRYEQHHAPAVLKALEERGLPPPVSYQRNHVVPEGTFDMSHRDGRAPDVAYDVITQIGFGADADPALVDALACDGAFKGLALENMLDAGRSPALVVEEYRSIAPGARA